MDSAHLVASAFRATAPRAAVLAPLVGLTAATQRARPRQRQALRGEFVARVIHLGGRIAHEGMKLIHP